MKITPKQIVFLGLKILFIAVIPCVIAFVGFGKWEKATGYKWSIGTILVLLVVVFIVKQILINKNKQKWEIKIANLETDLEKETDKGKIILIEDALKKYRVIQTIFSYIFPLLFLILACVCFYVVEKQIAKFFDVFLWVSLSELCGFAFSIVEALCVEGKHKNPKQKKIK